jgi:hypothetical protein
VFGERTIFRVEHVAEELLGQRAHVVLSPDEGQVAAVKAAQPASSYLENNVFKQIKKERKERKERKDKKIDSFVFDVFDSRCLRQSILYESGFFIENVFEQDVFGSAIII